MGSLRNRGKKTSKKVKCVETRKQRGKTKARKVKGLQQTRTFAIPGHPDIEGHRYTISSDTGGSGSIADNTTAQSPVNRYLPYVVSHEKVSDLDLIDQSKVSVILKNCLGRRETSACVKKFVHGQQTSPYMHHVCAGGVISRQAVAIGTTRAVEIPTDKKAVSSFLEVPPHRGIMHEQTSSADKLASSVPLGTENVNRIVHSPETHAVERLGCVTDNYFGGTAIVSSSIEERDLAISTYNSSTRVEDSALDDVDYVSATSSVECQEVDGRRIVDLSFLFNGLRSGVCQHDFRNYRITKYIDQGLRTQLFFKCEECDNSFNIWTDPNDDSKMGINESAVCGTITSGTGCYALQELLAAMDIPSLSQVTYGKYRDILWNWFESITEVEMNEAAAKEREIAIKKGNVIHGVPCIMVVADGCWPKRSYTGGAHDSLAGVAFILGSETGLVLHVGVRNKYCQKHAEAARLNKEPPPHDCFKNWSLDQSSTAMESDIIVEGFKQSVQARKLIYGTLISDGDSSSIQAIRNADPYAEYDVVVEKINCSNHLYRNLCKKVKEASKTKITAAVPQTDDIPVGQLRKRVHKSGLSMRMSVELATDLRIQETGTHSEKSIRLQKDILTIFKHTFGDHSACETLPFPCEPEESDINLIPQLEATGMYALVFEAVRYLSCHAESLLHKVTNNMAESANSIVNKLNAGKRINYCGKNSYHMRCYGAVVQHNTQALLSKVFRGMDKKVPSAVFQMEGSRQLHVYNNRLRRKEQGRHKRRRGHGTDKDYGPLAEKPDLADDVYDTLVEDHLDKLNKYQDDRDKIERDTISQSKCQLWHSLRTRIITASKFGSICRMLKTTSCAKMVESIRYPKVLDTAAVQYGIANEQAAKEALELKLGKTILPCGLFIDPEIAYLGASPDGLIDTDGIVEIKCPYSAANVSLKDAMRSKTTVRSIFHKTNPDRMNPNHPYYYQVQGQLHITRRTYCIFALWTSVDLMYITVQKDDDFWHSKMEPLLSRFYMECLLPEIVDSRRNRSLPIRDPEYILQARLEAAEKKEQGLSRKRRRDQPYQEVAETSPKSNGHDDNNTIVITQLPDSGSQGDRSVTTTSNAPNAAWARIEMDEDIEITEDDYAVLESVRQNIPAAEVIADILPLTNLLNDTSIDFFQLIVQENSEFRFNPACYMGYYRFIKPCETGHDMQIIGGNGSEHWCCVYYNGSQLKIYDSMNPTNYMFLHNETKRYIRKRYPYIAEDDVIVQRVTNQPDAYSCGVYATAFATAIALGDDPSKQKYVRDTSQMRGHLIRICQSRELIRFPTE